jgi:hypothetical protein
LFTFSKQGNDEQRLNCRILQLASLLASGGKGIGRNMREDAEMAISDCFSILAGSDPGCALARRRRRIVLVYRVKLALLLEGNIAVGQSHKLFLVIF